jgi:hypothetical protein
MSHLFEITTPLGFSVRCSEQYWEFIVSQKHPVLKGHEKEIQQVLENPDEIRRSKKDPQVYLFYQGTKPRWLCAVVRNENSYGFLITAYPTDAIKAGDVIWTKSKLSTIK